jgi:hypothetical protein
LLGDGADGEQRVRLDGAVVFQGAFAVALLPHDLAVLHQGDRQADAVRLPGVVREVGVDGRNIKDLREPGPQGSSR